MILQSSVSKHFSKISIPFSSNDIHFTIISAAFIQFLNHRKKKKSKLEHFYVILVVSIFLIIFIGGKKVNETYGKYRRIKEFVHCL